MEILVKQGDITEERVDAIVNAANSSLMGGGGVDGAIHRKGGPKILEECRKIREREPYKNGLPTGEAVHTSGGNLPCRYVIHAVGPVWQGGSAGEAQSLRNAYLNSLKLAESLGAKSVAFPNISTGAFGYPKDEAAKIAIQAARDYAHSPTRIERVVFVCFDEENLRLYRQLLSASSPKDDAR
ncbi:MAG: O-acetyl-ADP-ribose deacetylase [Chloroherpetonaceae bacterium]|nr:O-acetyl-ADP-ribose deacetylase [Chloroherpetonaceae bacterium]MDW8437728.1 O-acetyl-ADP-ribose deacetylase [Chloroherpetonaceae bacterium]